VVTIQKRGTYTDVRGHAKKQNRHSATKK